jgi:hypothetical protein
VIKEKNLEKGVKGEKVTKGPMKNLAVYSKKRENWIEFVFFEVI